MTTVIAADDACTLPIISGGQLAIAPGLFTGDVALERLGTIGGSIEPDDECAILRMTISFVDGAGLACRHLVDFRPGALLPAPEDTDAVLVSRCRISEEPLLGQDGLFIRTTTRFSVGDTVVASGAHFTAQQSEAVGRYWIDLDGANSVVRILAEVSGFGEIASRTNGEIAIARALPLRHFLWRPGSKTVGVDSECDVEVPTLRRRKPAAVWLERIGGPTTTSLPRSASIRANFAGCRGRP